MSSDDVTFVIIVLGVPALILLAVFGTAYVDARKGRKR